MYKKFNITGVCKPDIHYMVDLKSRLDEVKGLVDAGEYFTINKARQYGKTTMLHALARFLQQEYIVINLDFQMLSHASFANEERYPR